MNLSIIFSRYEMHAVGVLSVCIEAVCYFWQYRHFGDADSANLGTQQIFPWFDVFFYFLMFCSFHCSDPSCPWLGWLQGIWVDLLLCIYIICYYCEWDGFCLLFLSHWFMCVDVVSCDLAKVSIEFQCSLGWAFGPPIYRIMSSANGDNLTSLFPICIPLIYFSCFVSLASISSIMRNSSGSGGTLVCFQILVGTPPAFSHSICCWHWVFHILPLLCMLRNYPFMPN